MFIYLFRRLALLILTLLITSIVIFFITQLLPGDVCRVILGREVGQAALNSCHADLGLDKPALVRYLSWLGDFLRGNWGRSYSTHTEIRSLVLGRLRNSLMLAGFTLVLGIPLSLGLGVLAAVNEGRLVDNAISIAALSVVGMPEFVTGIVLIQILSFRFGLPANSSIGENAGFFEALPSLILPALTAIFVLLAYVARLTRAGVIEELKQSYVQTAEAKGLPKRDVIWRHVLPNAVLPAITVIAISFGWLISGLAVIENVFNYPGLGRLIIFAITHRDLPLLQACALVSALGFSLAGLVADFSYAWLNPLIRLGS